MKWQRKYIGMESKRRTKYVSGNYHIIRTQSKNIWTGKVMSEQVWEIFFNGIKIGYELTLKEAKARVEWLEKEKEA